MDNESKKKTALRRAPRLGITVLADDHAGLARRLAGPVEDRFVGVRVVVSPEHAITLPDGLARFDTSIYREVEAGDHTIVLLELHAAEHVETALPLVFHRSGFGTVGEARRTG